VNIGPANCWQGRISAKGEAGGNAAEAGVAASRFVTKAASSEVHDDREGDPVESGYGAAGTSI